MYRYALVAAAAALLSALGGCRGTTAAILEPASGINLPPPSEYTLRGTAGHLENTGSEFLPGSENRVITDGSLGVFQPVWAEGLPLERAAYAVYEIDISGSGTNFGYWAFWDGITPDHYIGMANFADNHWTWSGLLGWGQGVPLPANTWDYIDSSLVLVAVVAADSGSFHLERVQAIPPPGGELTNLFFLHHSTGHGIIDGGLRAAVAEYNATNGTSYEFWDHCYPVSCYGLAGPDGVPAGSNYGEVLEATDPPDLLALWTSPDPGWAAARNQILANHEVVAFKSCFPASNIGSTAELEERKGYYREMRDFFDTRTDRLFVVVSQPPLHPDETNIGNAGRAREFAEWLKSPDYLSGHPNVVCFDLFNELAEPLGSGLEASMLRAEYRLEYVDSHPNDLGNQNVAPVFANFLCNAAGAYDVP